MSLRKHHNRFLLWRARNMSNRNFLLLLAFITGLAGGLAAVVMKSAVHYIQHLLTLGLPAKYYHYLFFIYPLIGIVLTVLYRTTFRLHAFGHGMTALLLAITKRKGIVEREKMHTHIISAALTVGFGGSVGLEAPIVTTGAAIGSNLGQFFRMGYKKRMLLIGCGVAAGVSGIFNAPIAGILFCLEVLMLDLSIPAFIPLLIASVTGTTISRLIMGSEILFNYSVTDAFYIRELPFYILLAALTGLVSVYFLRTFNRTGALVGHIKDSYLRSILGGLALGLMIFLLPPLYGEGYGAIKSLLAGRTGILFEESFFMNGISSTEMILLVTALLILIKGIAAATTVASGGNGGTFAPALVTGGLTGFFVSFLLNHTGMMDYSLSERNFILVGMAGLMSGVLRAPLTAIFLIAEITGGYTLMLPLMLVSAVSYITSSYFEPHSVYLKKLARQGHVHLHDKDRVVLTRMRMERLVETDFETVSPEGKLSDLIAAVEKSRRNIFPVLTDDKKLQGIVTMDSIRPYLFKPELYDIMTVAELMQPVPAELNLNQSMEEAMHLFDSTGAWNLPVASGDGQFAGMISKSRIFSHYRKRLRHEVREQTEIIE